jgi:hypothetical protein
MQVAALEKTVIELCQSVAGEEYGKMTAGKESGEQVAPSDRSPWLFNSISACVDL